MTVRVVTCNTQGKTDGRLDFHATVSTVAAQSASFVGWQEANTERHRDVIRSVMGDGYALHHDDLSIPISVHKTWTVVRKGRRKAHKGRAGASPSRWIAWVVARHDDTGRTVVVFNTHFVSGAWNRRPKPYKTWRRQAWTVHWQLLRDLVTGAASKCPTVVVGDFNRLDVKPLCPSAVWADSRGIDKVAVSGLELARPAARVVTRSDHTARLVDLNL